MFLAERVEITFSVISSVDIMFMFKDHTQFRERRVSVGL